MLCFYTHIRILALHPKIDPFCYLLVGILLVLKTSFSRRETFCHNDSHVLAPNYILDMYNSFDYKDPIERKYLDGSGRTAYFAPGELSKIENYDEALSCRFYKWDIHHRLEINPDGSRGLLKKQLIEMGLYYHRPASELIFLTEHQHLQLHGRTQAFHKNTHKIKPHLNLEDPAWKRFLESKKVR